MLTSLSLLVAAITAGILLDTIFINSGGCQDALTGWSGGASKLSAGRLRLFQNNVTVSDATVLSGLTECTATGYAAVNLTSASWNAPTFSSPTASMTPVAAFSFTTANASPVTVYGAYITDSTNTTLLACWNFPAGGFTLPAGGGTITCSPTLTQKSLN
jgi:hypothetical protein